MEYEEKETRKEVIALCDMLGGSMIEGCFDQFRLKGFNIDLSATHTDYLGRVAIDQFEEQSKEYGKYTKTQEIKEMLGL